MTETNPPALPSGDAMDTFKNPSYIGPDGGTVTVIDPIVSVGNPSPVGEGAPTGGAGSAPPQGWTG